MDFIIAFHRKSQLMSTLIMRIDSRCQIPLEKDNIATSLTFHLTTAAYSGLKSSSG